MLQFLLLPLLLYLALAAFAFFYSERLIFLPPPASYRDGPSILKLRTADGQMISAIYRFNPQATYTLLYSHGNAEDLGTMTPRLDQLQSLGFSILAYDYRGYGTSQGVPSEANAYQDIDAAFHYLTTKLQVAPDRIILYGRSVGGGPSVDLATRQAAIAGLILEATFTSTFRVVTQISILPFDRFNNLSKIGHVRCPVLLLHGTQDEVIPLHHSETLYRHTNAASKKILKIVGADHNDLVQVAGDQYKQALNDFTASL